NLASERIKIPNRSRFLEGVIQRGEPGIKVARGKPRKPGFEQRHLGLQVEVAAHVQGERLLLRDARVLADHPLASGFDDADVSLGVHLAELPRFGDVDRVERGFGGIRGARRRRGHRHAGLGKCRGGRDGCGCGPRRGGRDASPGRRWSSFWRWRRFWLLVRLLVHLTSTLSMMTRVNGRPSIAPSTVPASPMSCNNSSPEVVAPITE